MQLSPPPRPLSLYSRMVILFGGFNNTFGWLFFGFGMIFFWAFVMNSEAIHWLSFSKWEETQGTVDHFHSSGASVNDVSVYNYIVEYQVKGKTYRSTCYVTGNTYSEGDQVTVAYKQNKPEVGKIVGSRLEIFDGWVLFVVIFPFVGFCFIIAGLRQQHKAVDLLMNGHLAKGKLSHKEATNTTINDRTVYKYTFDFTAGDGQTYQVIGKTHQYDVLEDDETERVLYAAKNPKHAFLVDLLPYRPEIDPAGYFTEAPWYKAYVLIIPAISLLGHGAYYYFTYIV